MLMCFSWRFRIVLLLEYTHIFLRCNRRRKGVLLSHYTFSGIYTYTWRIIIVLIGLSTFRTSWNFLDVRYLYLYTGMCTVQKFKNAFTRNENQSVRYLFSSEFKKPLTTEDNVWHPNGLSFHSSAIAGSCLARKAQGRSVD